MQTVEYFSIFCESESDLVHAQGVLKRAMLAAEVLDPHTVRAVVVHECYTWEKYRAVEAEFAASGIQGRLGHWRHTDYSEAEWLSADFWK